MKPKVTENEVREMMFSVICAVDYDIYKELYDGMIDGNPECTDIIDYTIGIFAEHMSDKIELVNDKIELED